jgi:hypothetical protein
MTTEEHMLMDLINTLATEGSVRKKPSKKLHEAFYKTTNKKLYRFTPHTYTAQFPDVVLASEKAFYRRSQDIIHHFFPPKRFILL